MCLQRMISIFPENVKKLPNNAIFFDILNNIASNRFQLLTHSMLLFDVIPFENFRKPEVFKGFQRFSDVFKGYNKKQWC